MTYPSSRRARAVVVAMLDKQVPFSHSFVDGMLGKIAAEHPEMAVWMLVSRGTRLDTSPRRYLRAGLWPVLFVRRGWRRFANIALAWRAGKRLIGRAKKRGQSTVLFVRNDPALLLAAALLRRHADRLVFQNSYPHAESAGFTPKGIAARWIYRVARRRIDAITGVSPMSIERLRRQFPRVSCAEYIPLLADLPEPAATDIPRHVNADGVVRFVYAGSHSPERRLETVLAAIVASQPTVGASNFTFVGGSRADIETLGSVPGVADLIASGRLQFVERTTRREVARHLRASDIGLCLIPPSPQYQESSPTKLAEYLAAGLAVLASDGIPLQSEFVRESGAGVLVAWDVRVIAAAVASMATDTAARRRMRTAALAYARDRLSYRTFFPAFCRLLGHENIHQA